MTKWGPMLSYDDACDEYHHLHLVIMDYLPDIVEGYMIEYSQYFAEHPFLRISRPDEPVPVLVDDEDRPPRQRRGRGGGKEEERGSDDGGDVGGDDGRDDAGGGDGGGGAHLRLDVRVPSRRQSLVATMGADMVALIATIVLDHNIAC